LVMHQLAEPKDSAITTTSTTMQPSGNVMVLARHPLLLLLIQLVAAVAEVPGAGRGDGIRASHIGWGIPAWRWAAGQND